MVNLEKVRNTLSLIRRSLIRVFALPYYPDSTTVLLFKVAHDTDDR